MGSLPHDSGVACQSLQQNCSCNYNGLDFGTEMNTEYCGLVDTSHNAVFDGVVRR